MIKKKKIARVYYILYALFFPLKYNRKLYKGRKLDCLPDQYFDEKAEVLITIEPRNFHLNYIKACEEKKVPYCLIDLRSEGWYEKIIKSNFKVILAWPSAVSPVWKEMYDERIKIIQDSTRIKVIPSFDETWFWESKRRMAYFFKANDILSPSTKIFYSYDEAKDFIYATKYPVVYKSNHGDSSNGVKIIKNKRQAHNLIRKAFRRGLNYGLNNKLDKELNFIIFQEYLNFQEEWRIIRTYNYYFGYKKLKQGYFASGSGHVIFSEIPEYLLNKVREITEKLNQKSMSFDIIFFNDKYYFIEAQAVFGTTQIGHKLEVDGKKGAYIFEEQNKKWKFIEGDFDKNNCCNARVEYALSLINN